MVDGGKRIRRRDGNAPMERAQPLGANLVEGPGPQKLGKQVVVAVCGVARGPSRAIGHDEEIELHEPVEDTGRIRPPGRRRTRLESQLRENARFEEEAADLGILALQNLLGEEVEHGAEVRGFRAGSIEARARPCLHGELQQAKSHRPTLGSLADGLNRLRGEGQPPNLPDQIVCLRLSQP